VVENVYYAQALASGSTALWVVRGFGTAVMHGGTTALFSVVAKSASDRRHASAFVGAVPGLALAVFIHGLYNHFFLNPILSTLLVVLLLPTVMAVVFIRGERSLREWVGVGFDTDQELLYAITSGTLENTNAGQYLLSLQSRFNLEDLVDMMCLLQLHTELAIQVKGQLILRNAGFDVPPDPTVAWKFDEIRVLQRNIGATGRLAMLPILHASPRDTWQLHLLGAPVQH
jgi:hypothetical protein